MSRKALVSLSLALFVSSPASAGWASLREAYPGPAEVIGFYTSGCVAGARGLPHLGEGYQVMRPSRNRHYGHPRLVSYVQRLGRSVAEHRLGRMLVGDMAQPRGGPMESGHRSHQTGLDVDIWLRLLTPGSAPLTPEAQEQAPMRSVVRASEGALDRELWSERLRELLRLAAGDDEVERIFVNPVIKQALCRRERDRGWLERVRPYWGHDAHFHIRLGCPSDSPRCRAQDPVPPGDGCDEALDRWVEEQRRGESAPRPAHPPPARPPLPAACDTLLEEPPQARRPARNSALD